MELRFRSFILCMTLFLFEGVQRVVSTVRVKFHAPFIISTSLIFVFLTVSASQIENKSCFHLSYCLIIKIFCRKQLKNQQSRKVLQLEKHADACLAEFRTLGLANITQHQDYELSKNQSYFLTTPT